MNMKGEEYEQYIKNKDYQEKLKNREDQKRKEELKKEKELLKKGLLQSVDSSTVEPHGDFGGRNGPSRFVLETSMLTGSSMQESIDASTSKKN